MGRWLWAVIALTCAVWGTHAQNCRRQADVTFVIDGSSGLTTPEFNNLLSLIKNFAITKSASPTSTLFASLLVVSDGQEKRTPLTDNMDEFIQEVDDVRFRAGASFASHTGIELAFNDLLLKSSPAGTLKLIIVLASQPSTSPETVRSNADFARDIGLRIAAVGLKNMPEDRLLVMGGSRSNVYRIPDVLGATSLPFIDLDLDGVDCPDGTGPNTPPTTRPTTPTTRPPTTPTTRRPTTPTTRRPTTPTTQRPTTPTTRRPTTPTTRRPTTPTTRRPTTPTTRPQTTPTTRRPTTPTTRRTVRTTRRTPSTRRPTTPRTTVPTTFKPLPTETLCNGANVVGGVGYTAHPTEPDSYIQCYYIPQTGNRDKRATLEQSFSMLASNIIAVVRQCSYGLYWNQATRTCENYNSVRSVGDACATSKELSRPINGNCRGYFRCVNKRSVPSCCPYGTTYTKFGCMACATCHDSCNMAVGTQYACMRYPVWDDMTSYRAWQWNKDGGDYVNKPCPNSCYYNLASCDCAYKPWENRTADTVCVPSIDIDARTNPFNLFETKNVNTQQTGDFLFNSPDSIILLESPVSFDGYNGPAVIQLRYMEMTELTSRKALLSSRPCTRAGYLLLTVDRESILLEVSTESGTLTFLRVPTVGFKPNEFKTVRVVDNNDYITLSVSNGQDAYIARDRAPTNPYLSCGLDIGSAQFVDNFQGRVSSVHR